MLDKQEQRTSRFLSLVLRHKPEAAGIKLDREGWVDIDTLLKGCSENGNPIDRAQLERIVEFNDKKRFAIVGDRIRAEQGHSVKGVAIRYVKGEPPITLYHGTSERFLDSIRKQGLIKGTRHHVHLSDNFTTAYSVGERHCRPVVLRVKARQMWNDRYDLFLAPNRVWLTDYVPVEYLVFNEDSKLGVSV